ncbi:MAG: hypothetical protein QGG36_12355 [Pirellulaceae bacterium]|jgi:hypothetical protein|nr:hypothetical protein [Pirellulaceae bacterium]
MAKKKVKRKAAAKSGPSKAAAIRAYMEANPEAGPTVAAADLNKQHGWKISAQYVSTIKSTSKSSGKMRRGKGGVDDLITAKKFADNVGGISNAKSLLDALAQLVD